MILRQLIGMICLLFLVVQDSPGQKDPAGGVDKMARICLDTESQSGIGYLEVPLDVVPIEVDDQPRTSGKMNRTVKSVLHFQYAWTVWVMKMVPLFLDLPPPLYRS
jgi:hypothetical protein